MALPRDLDRLLHDLRGPLNALTMHLEAVRRAGADDPAGLASLEATRQEVARLAQLLPAAFAVVALERGGVSRLNLGALVRTALEHHGVAAVAVADGPWPDVEGDPELLGLAVAHLTRNALAATVAVGAGRPPPRVSWRPAEPGRVALVVRDWGSGLRTTNSRALIRLAISPATGGPTVGLLTVERVARLHGGALEFSAPPDGGVEAVLTLPTV
jgi:two-component system osmolarity sensor histidine kinase EnvZ